MKLPAGSRWAPNFTLQDDIVAPAALESLTDQHFIVAHSVEVAGVEKCYPGIKRGVDRGDAFLLIGRSIRIGHAHGSQAQCAKRLIRSRLISQSSYLISIVEIDM